MDLSVETDIDITNTINETIDSSVFERWPPIRPTGPPGLARWAERQGVNPRYLGTAVMAYDPKIFVPI
jgi:hypothetical protein